MIDPGPPPAASNGGPDDERRNPDHPNPPDSTKPRDTGGDHHRSGSRNHHKTDGKNRDDQRRTGFRDRGDSSGKRAAGFRDRTGERRGGFRDRRDTTEQRGSGFRDRRDTGDKRGGGSRDRRDPGDRGRSWRPGDQRGEQRAGKVGEQGERVPAGEFEPRDTGPELPPDIEFSALDPEARQELRGLPKGLAEIVGKHLVAAGMLVDEDPQKALEHARYARSRAARVAIVREAAGLTAYHAGEWAEALAELRAVRRMSGGSAHLAVMADCERALGRPERAIELAAESGPDLPPAVAVELKIVSAGARRDMGQLDAAVVALQGPDLDPRRRDPWSARLFYAYADNLAAAGRTEDAIRWFLNAAEADDDEQTDAAERAVELGAAID